MIQALSPETSQRTTETFLVGPDVHVEMTRGWPYLRHNLVHDLAALTKLELLLWDAWGLAEQPSATDAELELLDRVAAAYCPRSGLR